MKKKKTKKYTLELTEKQARVISKSLEIMARIGIGQISTAIDLCYLFTMKDPKRVKALCDELKKELTGFEANASWGIHCPEVSDDFRIAYDIEQVIRHHLFKNDPLETQKEFRYTNSAYSASKTSTTEQLPIMENVND